MFLNVPQYFLGKSAVSRCPIVFLRGKCYVSQMCHMISQRKILFLNMPHYFSGKSAVYQRATVFFRGKCCVSQCATVFVRRKCYVSQCATVFLREKLPFSFYHRVSITEVGFQISIKRQLWVGGIQLSTFHEFRPKHRLLVRYLLGRA